MDIVDPFPESKTGNFYILVINDYFTCLIEGYTIPIEPRGNHCGPCLPWNWNSYMYMCILTKESSCNCRWSPRPGYSENTDYTIPSAV